MGVFKSVKENFRKAEAAVVIEVILDMQAQRGVFPVANRKRIAHNLVAFLWKDDPSLLDGSTYPYPNKAVVAARALAKGAQHEQRPRVRAALWIALGTVLHDLESNSFKYGLSQFDLMLLEGLWEIQQQVGNELDSTGETPESIHEVTRGRNPAVQSTVSSVNEGLQLESGDRTSSASEKVPPPSPNATRRTTSAYRTAILSIPTAARGIRNRARAPAPRSGMGDDGHGSF